MSQNLHKIDLWDLDTGKKLRTLEGPKGHGAMYFVPGSKLFVAAAERHYHDRKEKHENMADAMLVGASASKTVRVVTQPSGSKPAQFPGVEPPDAKQLSVLIAALDSGSFADRQKSTLVLEKMELARPALEESLLRNPSVEMRRRIESILGKQDAPSWSDDLKRAMRGVLLLEQIATPPARQLLRTLASGAPGSLLTQEAQAAMQRLKLGGGSRSGNALP